MFNTTAEWEDIYVFYHEGTTSCHYLQADFVADRRRVVLIFIFQFTFLVFLTVFEIGSAVCGAATSSDMLIVGRAVAGMGGAGLVNGVVISIASAVPLQRRPGEISALQKLDIVLADVVIRSIYELDYVLRSTWASR